jgi:SulP family sulfate permease
MAATPAAAAAKGARRLHVLEGVLPIDGPRIPADVIAGLTLAALAIPEVMGYTKIAGMPVITGLYTILIPIAVFALLGSSRHLVVGADSATAAIMFAGLTALATPDTASWIALAGWCALLTAFFLLLARLLKLGFLADFLSRTVLIGFLTGVGVQVACGQIAGMLGVPKTGSGALMQALDAILAIPQANPATVGVSAVVFALIVGGGLITKKAPWALIAVLGAIGASWYWDLVAKGVSVLGTVPSGLPQFGLPALPAAGQWTTLVTTSMSLFLVVLAQSAATSRAYAVRYNDRFSENTDLVGLSLANVAAGLSATFPVNGSPTKTEMVDEAGGRSQISQLTTAVVVLVVLLFLTKPLAYMPNAVLATVVFIIGAKLVDTRGMRTVLKVRPVEFWVASLTAATVVVVGVEQGIILAIIASLVAHLRHGYRPLDVLIAGHKDGHVELVPLEEQRQLAPGLLVYHFGAGMYYANAEAFSTEVRNLVESAKPPLEWITFEMSAVDDIDFSAAAMLCELIGELKVKKIRVVFTDALVPVKKELDVSGITKLVGEDAFFTGILPVREEFQKRDGGGPDGPGGR